MQRGSTYSRRRSTGAVPLLRPEPCQEAPSPSLGRCGAWGLPPVPITSNPYGDAMAVCLADTDFSEGSLFRESFARPGKLFTANESLMLGSVGVLSTEKQREIVEAITHILHAGLESEPVSRAAADSDE